jgi:hypothetical protein
MALARDLIQRAVFLSSARDLKFLFCSASFLSVIPSEAAASRNLREAMLGFLVLSLVEKSRAMAHIDRF